MTLPPMPDDYYKGLTDGVTLLVRRTAFWRTFALSASIAFIAALVLYMVLTRAILAPQIRIEQRLDELTQFNRAIIHATCDSANYSAVELAGRSKEQRARLRIVCANRRKIDSALADIQQDTAK